MQGGTPQFHATEVEIRALAEQVFPYLVEPEKLKQWVSGMAESRALTQDGLVVGAKLIEVVENDGKRVQIEAEIARIEKNQLVQLKMRSSYFDAVNHLDLTSTPHGTEVTQNLTVTYKGLARFFVPFRDSRIQGEWAGDLNRLKEIVEKSNPPSVPPE